MVSENDILRISQTRKAPCVGANSSSVFAFDMHNK